MKSVSKKIVRKVLWEKYNIRKIIQEEEQETIPVFIKSIYDVIKY